MQLLFRTSTTAEQYVSRELWRSASLPRCPRHPGGGCGLSRHGTYRRVSPSGVRIARFRCPKDKVTFSLLPEFLASRFSSTLEEAEQAALQVERRAGTMAELAAEVRPAVEPDDDHVPGAVRWLRRRARAVESTLRVVARLRPAAFGAQPLTLAGLHEAHGGAALVWLRVEFSEHLDDLPPPVGFGRSVRRGSRWRNRTPHEGGADPPGDLR